MSWILVVSSNEDFQREAIARLRDRKPVVGATGEGGARRLFAEVPIAAVIIDAKNDTGLHFLAILGAVPSRSLPSVIAVGTDRSDGRYLAVPDLKAAVKQRVASAA